MNKKFNSTWITGSFFLFSSLYFPLIFSFFRFAEKVADEIKPEDLHDQTVELVIQLFRKLTMENLKHDNLAMILVSAGKTDNKQVKVLVKKIQSNLDK